MSVFFYIIVVSSLIQGKAARLLGRSAPPIYRDEDPASFRNQVVLHATLGSICLLISISNWTTELDLPKYSSYTVAASPQQSLETALQAASSIRNGGDIAYGLTSWDVSWHFEWSQAKHGDACWISSVCTTLNSNIVLPKLVKASSAQQEKFNIFFDALRAHQLAHYEFGKNAAREIERQISMLPEMPNCATLEATANALGGQILKDYQVKGKAYDLSNTFLQAQHAMLQ